MMVSDEEKRWLVVGIAMNKVAALVLRDFIKQGMDRHYTNLDIYCSGLATPCTLKTLTYHQVSTDPRFKHLKFQNVNNNLHLYGMKKKDFHKYNYNINSSIDLAKLYLPEYLAEFSGFDESLDMSAILRLLGFNNPAPIFHSPNPLISIQSSADDVRENVRNRWGHCDVTDWTKVFFTDCFSKLNTLVRSLGLTGGMEKTTLDNLSDWETKGCQLCMGHAVDQNLLSLVQQDVKNLVKDYKTTEESLAQQRVDLTAMQNTVISIQDQQSATRAQLEEHDQQLAAVLEWKEQQMKENEDILQKFVSVEKMLSEELLIRVEGVEKGLAETDNKVEQLEQGFAKRDDKVEQLEQGFAKTDDKVKQLEQGFAKTDDKVEQLEQGFAKADDKVEQLEQGFAKTDDKVEQLEQGFAKTDDKVEQLEQGFAKTDDKVEQLEQGFAKTDVKVEQLEQGFAKTDDKVKQLEEAVRSQRMKENEPGSFRHDRPPSLLEHKTGPQTPVQTYKTSHPQRSRGCRPSSMEYSRSSTLAGQNREGQSYQTWHSPTSEKPARREAYFTGQCRDSAGPAVRQITSDSSLSPDLLGQMFLNLQEMQCDVSKINSTTDPSVELEKIASGKGFVISDNEGSGNCMFYALSEQLNLVKGIKISHGELRQSIVQYLLNNRRLPDGTDLFNFIDGYRSWADYLANMEQDGTWGDHVILYATANCYKTYIRVISSQSNHRDFSIRPDGHAISTNPLVLGHVHEVHYVSLLPKQGSSGHGRPPSLVEHKQLPFPAVPQTPAQTYQTSHPQSSSGYLPSSMDYSSFPLALVGQTHEGPSYQTWHSPTMLMTGGYSQLPFHAATQTHGEPIYLRSHHLQSSSVQGRPSSLMEHNQLPFPACSQTPVQTSQTQSHHPQKAPPAEMFDVKACQRKLAEHYLKTAKVPTTAWSSVLQADLEQIYTRLSWVKQKQTTAGSSQKELNHYTEIFTEKTTNGVVAKRILVQGETGIGKTTFVKKLLVDWSNLQEAETDEEREDALRKFDLILAVNLKEVSECQTFEEVISRSQLFPKDEEKSVDDLFCYIRANQDKVLLVFDGYDEYRTGSEAEERYGSRSNSPIFEIFHGDILRHCTVLVTTRSSRADEIRGPADMQAEITGFNERDREDFMRKMLDSQTEVDDLLHFLWMSNLVDLARVPLLSLFFCLLWNQEKGKLKELTERKAKLYQAIVKHILQHSHRRRQSSSKASKLTETDYEEILAEIGKVALVGLLKGDLLFEFGQLSEKVRDDEGVIVGLFQFSEYGPSQEPMEMVSFIHKSIQEYLAAWYLIYSCVPKGNLGEIEQHADTLENCEALENVFQFVCALSDEGAMKVLEHLKSVRISDPTLDLSKTIPDVETETDVPLCDVTYRHERFSNLVFDSFREVQSKADLLSQCLDCTGGVVLVTRDTLLSELIPDVKVFIKLARNCVFILGDISFDLNGEDSIMYKSLEFLDCLQLPVRITERAVLKVEDLIRTLRLSCVSSILCFRNGRFQFYLTELFLHCDDYAKLFTESTSIDVPSDAANLCSQQSCLKFLSLLRYHNLSAQTVKALGAVIRSCEHLHMIELVDGEDSMCYLLEQVQNPSKCSVTIYTYFIHPDVAVDRASAGAVQLASLLPRFNNIIFLHLVVGDCCAAALDTLVSGIKHKTVENLILSDIRLTPAVAEVLGRSLPEMSSLQVLKLHGTDDWILNAEKMEALFGGFNKTLPLCNVTLSSFGEISCLAPFIESLRFFPNLRELNLEKLNLDEHDLCGLLESWSFIRDLTKLRIWGNQQSCILCCTLGIEKILSLGGVNLTPAVATTLGRILPEMSSLQTLNLTGVDGSILQTEEMEALFGKLHKPLPLHELDISGYNVRGSLAPLIKSLRFFPNLTIQRLEKLNMDVDDQCGLLESLKFIPHLTSLRVQSKTPVHGDCSTPALTLTSDSSALRTSKSLNLNGISLTPATAASLGRSLPEMASLETLEFTGHLGILQAEETNALFGGFSKIISLSDLNVFPGFNVTGSIAPLTNSFRFFPNLVRLCLVGLNMDEHNVCGLLENLKFVPKLMELTVHDGGVSYAHCRTAERNPVSGFTHNALRKLELNEIDLTPAVAVALGRLLPEMLTLQNLRLQGLRFSQNVLDAEEMEALFGGFNKRLPLVELSLCVFRARGGPLGSLTKSLCFFPDLEQLYLGGFLMDEHNLCALLESLRFIPNLKELSVKGQPLGDAHCYAVEINTMASITHKTLKRLKLDGVSLTPETATLLGRSLHEMSSLQTLELTGVEGSTFQAEEMVALFGGFNKTLPLHWVTLRNFSFSGCLATLCKSFHSFPNLKSFKLERLSLGELDLCSLLESLRFIPSVRAVSVKSKHHDQGHALWYFRQDRFSSFTLEPHERLHLDGISLTPVAAAALGRSLPEMSSLQVLQLTGVKGSILQAEDMQALFGGFYKSLPLRELTLSGFSVRGCLSPLIKSLQFFSSLKELRLEHLAIEEHDQCGLLKSFGFIRNLTKLGVLVSGEECLDSFHDHRSGLTTVVSHAHGEVGLYGIKLTPAVFAGLGQLLCEMLFLQDLRLTGLDGSILGAEEMAALFGGFSKAILLYRLFFSGFSVRGSLAPLNKSFRFFPKLKELHLCALNMDEHDLPGLLESFHFIPNLQLLDLSNNPLGHAVTSIVPHVINLKKLKCLSIDETGLSEEDLIYVRDTVQQALPGILVRPGLYQGFGC